MDAARLEELVQSAGTSRISSKETTFGRNGTTKGCQAVSSYTSESHCKKSFQKTKFLCTHSAQKETYETSSFCFACSKSARASRTAVSYCIDGCQNPTETTSTAVWKTLEFAACRRYVCLRGRFS